MLSIYKFCRKENLIQPPGEPRWQHLGEFKQSMSKRQGQGLVQWKTAEIKRRCASVKSAELFALDHGAGQLCHLYTELYRNFLDKPISLTLLADSQTTIDSLWNHRPIIDKMNQHLLDNVKKCVDQDGVVVKFISTGHNFAGPLTKRIKDHANMETVMSSRPVTF